MSKIRVLVVGCGNMGSSHAIAYEQHPGFEICGLVSRGASKKRLLEKLTHNYPLFDDFSDALKEVQPDAVCINTYPETHEPYCCEALENNCHVFLEKPIATTVEGGERVAQLAKEKNKKVVIGYILRHHPVWQLFVKEAQQLGKPLVMRMNLNQQSSGFMWDVHKNLMQSLSPIVDCGVHYLDVMCQMTAANPLSVSAIGVRLTDEIPSDNYNYGQLQIRFDDGSVGWYEAGWGPMMSENAFFIKDVIGPKGAVSLAQEAQESDNVDGHTQTDTMRIHHAQLNAKNEFIQEDTLKTFDAAPGHQELCDLEQDYFYAAIKENTDLTQHLNDAIKSLQIALACDLAVKTGTTVEL
jgi:predicted dehydrogenase